jgi:hypothetical protein
VLLTTVLLTAVLLTTVLLTTGALTTGALTSSRLGTWTPLASGAIAASATPAHASGSSSADLVILRSIARRCAFSYARNNSEPSI